MKGNIKHVWSVLCSGVSIDQNTNNLTLFNIIEQIKISENKLVKVEDENKLAIPLAFSLVTLWRREDHKFTEKVDVGIEVVDPNGLKRKSNLYSFKFTAGMKRMRYQIRWGGIKVTTSGTYKFIVSLKEAKSKRFVSVGEAYLEVEILPSGK